MRPNIRLALVATFALAACAKQLAAPNAIAAADKPQVAVGAIVGLTAKDSADPNTPPQPLYYHWAFRELPPGSHAAINDPALVNPSFVADVEGAYTVTLVVRAGKLSSQAAEVTVAAGPCGQHAPTVSEVKATPDKPGRGQAVLLTAAAADADIGGDCNLPESLTYDWRILELPPGSQAKLNQPDALTPSFVVDAVGDYVVQLVVRDSTGLASEAKTLTISAKVCGSNAPSVEAPKASPAAPGVGETVQLSAKATDADDDEACAANQTLTFHWYFVSLPAGSAAKLNDPEVEKPSFVADLAGDYVLRAKVSDGTGLDTVSAPLVVKASACGGAAPAIAQLAATPAQPNSGQTVQLTAGVTDADADASCGKPQSFRYAWRLVALPAGSLARLNDGGATNPSFVADLPGTYTVGLVVTDQSGLASPATTFSFQASTCGHAAPSARIAVPVNAAIGALVGLFATVTDADTDTACGRAAVYSYAWSFAAIPAGSKASLNDPVVQAPSFTADQAGTFTLKLVVTDTDGHASLPAFADLTVSACGGNAPTATVAATPTAPSAGALVQLSAVPSDADNDPATCGGAQTFSFAWRFVSMPSGSAAALQNPSLAAPYFTADLPGDYQLALEVTDSTGRQSAPATVTVTANICGANRPTATIAQTPASVGAGMAVRLTPTVTDADNAAACQATANPPPVQAFSYQWTLLSAPTGSGATLVSASARDAAFLADRPGTYLAQLVVTDSTGLASAPATITVVADSCGANAPTATVATDKPNPGVGQAMTLTATVDDADNGTTCQAILGAPQVLAYQWKVTKAPAGSSARVLNASSPTASFVPDVAGDYALDFVASDQTRLFVAKQLTFTALQCGMNTPSTAPTVDASSSLNVGGLVLLRSNPSDADTACGAGSSFTKYRWQLVEAPAGSRATLLQGVKDTSFVPDVGGTYVASVEVTDQTGLTSAPASVSVSVNSCGSNSPVARITGPGSILAGQVAQFNALGAGNPSTDADNTAPCSLGQQLSFRWELFSSPAGNVENLQPTSQLTNPWIQPDVKGPYVVRLKVTDSTGLSSDWAQITLNVQ